MAQQVIPAGVALRATPLNSNVWAPKIVLISVIALL